MRQKSSNAVSLVPADDKPSADEKAGPQGSQTLLRGLDMLDQVIDGPVPLAECLNDDACATVLLGAPDPATRASR